MHVKKKKMKRQLQFCMTFENIAIVRSSTFDSGIKEG